MGQALPPDGAATAGSAGADPVEVESVEHFAGTPDAFERLWTPHRMVYVKGDKPTSDKPGVECPFCRVSTGTGDEEALVVNRGRWAFVILNLFPYNPGHLMVCPYRHVADYTELTPDETVEVAILTRIAMQVLRQVSAPHGFNLGMNQGTVAGAGIAAHLHQHVVPRWSGDANFLPVVGRTRALPELLADTWAKLRAAWPSRPQT